MKIAIFESFLLKKSHVQYDAFRTDCLANGYVLRSEYIDDEYVFSVWTKPL